MWELDTLGILILYVSVTINFQFFWILGLSRILGLYTKDICKASKFLNLFFNKQNIQSSEQNFITESFLLLLSLSFPEAPVFLFLYVCILPEGEKEIYLSLDFLMCFMTV